MFLTTDIFINSQTLNIFCDASMELYDKNRNFGDGCYGAIAYYGENKIDELYRNVTGCTNNNAEIKAIRAGVQLAIKYKYNFSVINIFSDSIISIYGIRDYIFKWTVNPVNNDLRGYNNIHVASQSVFIEILSTIVREGIYINFYHQKGHININNEYHLKMAEHVFEASNNIRDGVDIELIKYISSKNYEVDKTTRKILKENKNSKKYIDEYGDAVVFNVPENFKKIRKQYKKLINGGQHHARKELQEN